MSCFEAEHTMFAKASVTLSSALRAAQMLNLHQVDILQSDGSMDWIELEERRRTWWTIFCFDRFVYATTGWPALIHNHKVSLLSLNPGRKTDKSVDKHPSSSFGRSVCIRKRGANAIFRRPAARS